MVILDFKRFSQAVSAGGATGSGRAKIGDQNYQLKPSLRDNPSFFRRQLARFKKPKKVLDYENMAEFLASRMATKLLDDPKNQKVPEVSFVVSETDNKVKVASKYLPGFQELLHDKDTQFLKPDSDANKIGEKLKKDQVVQVCDAIAISILFKDHDINPQNISNDGRRIDFGHAFNETLSLPRKAGGGVKNKSNEVLDYLNREELPSSTGVKSSKLWRSYEELVVTHEMANSLAKTAELVNNKSAEEIAFAKEGFMELMNHFDARLIKLAREKEITRDSKVRNDLNMKIKALEEEKRYQIESLVAINTNLGGSEIFININNHNKAIDKAFETIANDHNKQAKDMQKVAQLMNIQIMLKDKVKKQPDFSSQELELLQQALKDLKLCDSNGKITWIKEKKNAPAFEGTIQEFILHNAKIYGLSKAKLSKIEAGMVPVEQAAPFVEPVNHTPSGIQPVKEENSQSQQKSVTSFMMKRHMSTPTPKAKIRNIATNSNRAQKNAILSM
jgi:hypothetical protein